MTSGSLPIAQARRSRDALDHPPQAGSRSISWWRRTCSHSRSTAATGRPPTARCRRRPRPSGVPSMQGPCAPALSPRADEWRLVGPPIPTPPVGTTPHLEPLTGPVAASPTDAGPFAQSSRHLPTDRATLAYEVGEHLRDQAEPLVAPAGRPGPGSWESGLTRWSALTHRTRFPLQEPQLTNAQVNGVRRRHVGAVAAG